MMTKSAFAEALPAILPALHGYARWLSRDSAASEDLVQDALTRAWAARDQFQVGSNFKAWLFTILRNVFLSEVRRRRFRAEWNDLVADRALIEPAGQEMALLIQECRDALGQFPEKYRDSLLAIARDGLSYEEASARFRVPVGTLKSRVFRAREALWDYLANGRSEPGKVASAEPRLVYNGFVPVKQGAPLADVAVPPDLPEAA